MTDALAAMRLKASMCGIGQIAMLCGCGPRMVERRCHQRWLCDTCRQDYYLRLYHRLIEPMRNLATGYFLTLTTWRAPIRVQRATIELGWRRWRARAWRKHGAPPYILVWEVTQGRDRKGHVHAHVAWHGQGLDYGQAYAWWRESTAALVFDAREMYGLPEKRARYLAKYVSKGVTMDSWPRPLAEELVASWVGKRVYSPSKGYLPKPQRGCHKCGEICRDAKPMDFAIGQAKKSASGRQGHGDISPEKDRRSTTE